jgi:hypothetical protein
VPQEAVLIMFGPDKWWLLYSTTFIFVNLWPIIKIYKQLIYHKVILLYKNTCAKINYKKGIENSLQTSNTISVAKRFHHCHWQWVRHLLNSLVYLLPVTRTVVIPFHLNKRDAPHWKDFMILKNRMACHDLWYPFAL